MSNKRLAIQRVLILAALYIVGFTLFGYLAFQLRFDFDVATQYPSFQKDWIFYWSWIVALKLGLLLGLWTILRIAQLF